MYLGRWKMPESNQIDYVVISRRNATSVLDVRIINGPNYDSDHFLIRAVLRLSLIHI